MFLIGGDGSIVNYTINNPLISIGLGVCRTEFQEMHFQMGQLRTCKAFEVRTLGVRTPSCQLSFLRPSWHFVRPLGWSACANCGTHA